MYRPRVIYVDETGAVSIFFDEGHAARVFAEAWADLYVDWRFGGEQQHADYLFSKLQKIRRYVERYIKIEHELYNPSGADPWVEVRFKDEAGNELAHINLRWDGKSLRADFRGSKENAERLALILNTLGAKAEARKHGGAWRVVLTTDSITTIRRPEWLDAVRILVNALRERGIIGEEQWRRLTTDIGAGPNVVKIAGVELSVEPWSAGERLIIWYRPTSAEAFDYAVKALKDAGFEEGVHFTAKRPEKDKPGYVRLKLPAGLWRFVELERAGVEWAEETLDRLREIARERGFRDLLEEYLRPAEEAETLDPKKVAVEDPERGIKIVIKNLQREWEDGRPRIVVEYEANGRNESFYFVWGVRKGRVLATVRLDDERAAVLSALTGDELIKGKRGVVSLSAKHLIALARFAGVGWDLLKWYAEVMRE